jgi:hypothetical protein
MTEYQPITAQSLRDKLKAKSKLSSTQMDYYQIVELQNQIKEIKEQIELIKKVLLEHYMEEK